ncbi:hypothetical protein GY45DRAFT_1257163 [Cubamyces sp. BRFM 1775]|nr:hypothetical protein GY45DRAFT_1257163 [Cubamyces sp. BRFM 1775]
MNLFWLYRVLTLVSTCILSIVVIVLCAQTTIDLDDLLKGFSDHPSLLYANLGIAVGCITAFTTIVMICLDICCDKPFTSLPAFELPWFCVLWILWVVSGAITLLKGDQMFGEIECTALSVISPYGKAICDKYHPIAIIAFVNFALCEYCA